MFSGGENYNILPTERIASLYIFMGSEAAPSYFGDCSAATFTAFRANG
jgi:hypothetical protein